VVVDFPMFEYDPEQKRWRDASSFTSRRTRLRGAGGEPASAGEAYDMSSRLEIAAARAYSQPGAAVRVFDLLASPERHARSSASCSMR